MTQQSTPQKQAVDSSFGALERSAIATFRRYHHKITRVEARIAQRRQDMQNAEPEMNHIRQFIHRISQVFKKKPLPKKLPEAAGSVLPEIFNPAITLRDRIVSWRYISHFMAFLAVRGQYIRLRSLRAIARTFHVANSQDVLRVKRALGDLEDRSGAFAAADLRAQQMLDEVQAVRSSTRPTDFAAKIDSATARIAELSRRDEQLVQRLAETASRISQRTGIAPN